MKVFVTGASGFVGSAVVRELLQAGHQVLGMVRSDKAAEQLKAIGAEVHRGDLYNTESIKSGAAVCDAVIHTAFDHDFSKYKDNCETDRKVIAALAATLAGTSRPLVITSAVGLVGEPGKKATENDQPKPASAGLPRIATEEAAQAASDAGIDTYLLRLPPTVHGEGDHGFVPMLINIAREKGTSAYTDKGQNRWAAVHRLDAAVLYRLVVEQKPALKTFHAVAEEGVIFRDIAEAIGAGLQLPVVSKTGEDAAAYFGWFTHFAGMDCEASSAITRTTTGWEPAQSGLLKDMEEGRYF